jgi:hypothetical protein
MPADSNLHVLHNSATQVNVASDDMDGDEIFRKTYDGCGRRGQTCTEHGELRKKHVQGLVGDPKMKISVDSKAQMER